MLTLTMTAGGLAGFVLMFAFDWMTTNKTGRSRGFVGLAGLSLLVASTLALLAVTVDAQRMLSAPGIAFTTLGLAFFGLLAYSLFFELPKETYAGEDPRHLVVDTGTWALCRHPGLLWFALGYASLALAARSFPFSVAAIVWTVADIVYVILQERFFFRKIFADYERYAATTPMLIPNRASVEKCLATIGRKSRP